MPALYRSPTPGATIWYNGVTFTPAALTTEFSATPIQDQAKRTITHTVFSITIKDTIAGRPSDADVEQRLSALLIPAAGFIYNGRGLGEVKINLGDVQDMAWGPFPKLLTVKPLGGSNAVELTWKIEFATLNCGDADTSLGGVMEWNYKLTWDIDKSGYTKRIHSGFVRIAATRKNVTDRRIYVSADEWRERINPPLPEGYRPVSRTFELDEAKTTLRYTIVDEQMPPNIPPPGIIEANVSHEYTTAKLLGATWTANFEGEYELARGTHPIVAYQAWSAALKSRTDELKKIVPTPSIIPHSARVSETNIYGKTIVRVGLTYGVVTGTLGAILASGGLWKAVPGSNWKLWQASLSRHLGSRGISQLAFRPGEDAIIDLCGPKEVEVRSQPQPVDVDLRGARPIFPVDLRGCFPQPKPSTSYLRYTQSLRVEDDHGNVIVKLLPTKPIEEKSKSSGAWETELRTVSVGATVGAVGAAVMGGTRNALPKTGGLETTPFPPANDQQFAGGGRLDTETAGAISHQRVSPTLYVYLEGEALRAGYQIPVPELALINGVAPTVSNRPDMGEGFAQAVVGNGCGIVPLYGAKWRLRYCLTETPDGPIPVPPNPLLGT